MGTMTVIWWRDIPAQVTAREGRKQSKIVLHPRFQVAIDKAASRAGKRAYNDYIEEWRRTQARCGEDIDGEVAAEAERLAGAHCYEFYATSPEFAKLVEDEPATFFLTDFLARNFDRLVIKGLGLDRHPELRDQYFGNYQRLVYLAQTDDPALTVTARRAARRLGLRYERRRTGYGELATTIAAVAAGQPAPPVTSLLDFGGR